MHTKRTLAIVYDYTTALLAEEAGIDLLLVNDDVNILLYQENNVRTVSEELMVQHAKAVVLAAKQAQTIVDIPYVLFTSTSQWETNVQTFLTKTGAQGVKIEGGKEVAHLVQRITRLGILVMGHIGLNPKKILDLSACTSLGKTSKQALDLFRDAEAIQNAGASYLLLDAITEEVAAYITENLDIPTIGIGSGSGCWGIGMVAYDLLGLSVGKVPTFAKSYAQTKETFLQAFQHFVREVQEGAYPDWIHAYHMSTTEQSAFRTMTKARAAQEKT